MKPQDLKCFQQVADVIGPEYADYELQRVIDEGGLASGYSFGLDSRASPQGFYFWDAINDNQNPYDHGHTKPEL